jgi:effector-binding domain-containing protein
MKTINVLIAPLALLVLTTSCNSSKEKTAPTIATVDNKKIEVLPTNPQKGAVINMQDTVEIKRTVLCLKDSSKTREGMYVKLADIYNKKLPDAIKANKLIVTGAPIAWHTMQKAAYFFEAGIPVNKAPAKPGKGMYMKNTGSDSVYIAHFFGPNDLTIGAYDAIKEKAKENHKVTSAAYEVYIDNPFVVTTEPLDLYKLQTDIVWPFRNKGQAPTVVKVAESSNKKETDKKDDAKKEVVKKKPVKKQEEKKEE